MSPDMSTTGRPERELPPSGGQARSAKGAPISISTPFIDRPVATTLLTIGFALAGAVAFRLLPVSPLPRVDLPTISVSALLPGASPETMAATVAMPDLKSTRLNSSHSLTSRMPSSA